MRIQLLSFPGCPNVPEARKRLSDALADLGMPEEFEEIDVTDAACDPALVGWGSPTILIDGRDVEGAQPSSTASCRLYRSTAGLSGVPSEVAIRSALERATRIGKRGASPNDEAKPR
jgi:mercuric ion transport protein